MILATVIGRLIGASRIVRDRRSRGRQRPARVVILGAKGLPGVNASGGVERGVEQLTGRLARLGVSCVVYERGARTAWRRAGRTLVRQVPFIDSKNHAHWTHDVLSVLDYLGHRRRGDVIHLHSVQSGFLSVPLRLLGHRVIFHMHGQEWRGSKWGPAMSFFMKASIAPTVISSEIVATVCTPSRQMLAARFPRRAHRIVYVPNGLPIPLTPPVDQNLVLADYCLTRGQYFLYAGRLVPEKRIELAIHALRIARLPHILVIAGTSSHSPEYVRELESLVTRCGLAHQVKFVGQLGWNRLLSLYLNCRAVVHPSDREGCSNTLLEAVAASACVICTDLPENRAVLGAAALYLAPGDACAVARAMQTLESDEALQHRRQLTAAQRLRLQTWDDVTETFLRLYRPADTGRERDSDERVPLLATQTRGRA